MKIIIWKVNCRLCGQKLHGVGAAAGEGRGGTGVFFIMTSSEVFRHILYDGSREKKRNKFVIKRTIRRICLRNITNTSRLCKTWCFLS